MNFFRYKLTIEYDGSSFWGFAKQKDVVTIQTTIENKLKNILNYNKDIEIFCSGRTDRYVHANNQVIHFDFPFAINIKKVLNNLNHKMDEINFKTLEIVPSTFHARFSSIEKEYHYKIKFNEKNPFLTRYYLFRNEKLNTEKIESIFSYFIGEKDFSSFSISNEKLQNKSPIREVKSIKFKMTDKDTGYFEVVGTSFLRFMVRNIIGVILAFNDNIITKDELIDFFENPQWGKSTYKAKGAGLYLYNVKFKKYD